MIQAVTPPAAGPDLTLTGARVLDLASGIASAPQDVHIVAGRLSRVAPRTPVEIIDVDGGLVMPGLWDHHVHFGQWSLRSTWVDLRGAESPTHTAHLLRDALHQSDGDAVLVGHGFRDSRWAERPDDEVLEQATGNRAVVALSGDLHSVWANRAALQRLGLDHHTTGHLVEEDAFEVARRVTDVDEAHLDALVATAGREAAAKGLVGVTDFDMVDGIPAWQRRMEAGFSSLVVRSGIYPQWLGLASERRLSTDDVLDEIGVLTVGPLKVISDGSLTARTAWCCEPYADSTLGTVDPANPHGLSNVAPDELAHLMSTATAQGLTCAIHAIGDAAVTAALDAFESTGASGSIEHAQLVTAQDIARMADLGVRASVQPAHLLDDRDAMDALWPGRTQNAFPLASMAQSGVRLLFGSDAPVSPLDPWLAIESAVRRTGDTRESWHAEQCLTVSQALLASCRGVGSLVAGAEADLIVLADNPFEIDASRLSQVRPVMTMVGGSITHQST